MLNRAKLTSLMRNKRQRSVQIYASCITYVELISVEPVGGKEQRKKKNDRRLRGQDAPHADQLLLPAELFCNRDGGSIGADDSASLAKCKKGKAKITTASTLGVVRALASFQQLFFKHSKGGIYTTKAPVKISDSPKFSHRGISLDVARNFYSKESILRTLRGMFFNKLNRLHIHATDRESWPLEIPALPGLAKKGSYGESLTYSPEDVAQIQEYAFQRGIEVIFELEVPGHSGSINYSYPDVMAGQSSYGQLRLNDSSVDNFLDTLVDDLLPRLAPFSKHFHTGGDEIIPFLYQYDPSVRSSDLKVLVPLLQKFTDKHHARVRKHGFTPIVWEDMILDYNLTVGHDVIVQSWKGGNNVKSLTSTGHKVIVSNSDFLVRT